MIPTLNAAAGLQLRRPIYDPPSPPVVPPPPPPPLTLKLLGTIIEGKSAKAILQDATGKRDFKRVGDICDGAEILAISVDSIVVRYLGAEQKIRVERSGTS